MLEKTVDDGNRMPRGGKYMMEGGNDEIEFRGVAEHGFEIHSLGFQWEVDLRRDLVAMYVY